MIYHSPFRAVASRNWNRSGNERAASGNSDHECSTWIGMVRMRRVGYYCKRKARDLVGRTWRMIEFEPDERPGYHCGVSNALSDRPSSRKRNRS